MLAAVMVASAPSAAFAVADPSSLTTVSGNTTSVLTAPGQLQTTQTTNRAIITGSNVDVLEGEAWHILQPSTSSALLVRVNGGNATKILGELSANGQLMLVNGSGVFFGKNSQVSAASLIVSTADISNENFNAGRLKFDRPGRADASIINHGKLTASEGGLVALLAPGVKNDGVIAADLGTVAIGAGEAFTLDFYGDNLFSFSVDKKAEKAAKDENGDDLKNGIENAGTVKGGRIYMTAETAKGVVDRAINTTGIVEATSAHREGGVIVLDGGEGDVKVAGSVKASGSKGGSITVASKGNITLASDARVDASGDTQGGTVRIGGDKRGKGSLAHAQTVDVDSGAVIDASAKSGNGGDVVVWSDTNTDFNGFINVSSKDGNGGNAEVSSKDTLAYRGFTDATGKNFGTLLLDPGNWTISTAASDGNHYNNSDLATQLNSANVTIDTATAAPQVGDLGDINVMDAVSWSGNGALTLNAGHDVNVYSKISATGAGALSIKATNNVFVGKTAISTKTGTIGITGKDVTLANSTVNSTSGNITVDNSGVFNSNTKNSLNTGGNLSLKQNAGGSIQNAVDAVGTIGGTTTLALGAGTYNENVTLDTSNFSLVSTSGAAATTINGVAGKGQTGTISVAVGAHDVHIGAAGQGLTINGVDNSKAGVVNAGINFLGNNGGSTVDSNVIHSTGATTHGVYIANTTGKGASGLVKVVNNELSDIGGDAVRLNNSGNVLISGNAISNTGRTGVLGVSASDVTVDNNKLTKIGSTTSGAIVFINGGNLTVSNNTIYGTRNGVSMSNSTGKNLISNNNIDKASVFGILIDHLAGTADGAQGVTVTGNVIGQTSGSGSGSGIANTGSQYATISNNTISNYHGGINVNSGAVGNVISGNTINLPTNATGIILDNNSNNSRLSNNTINGGTGTTGISIARSHGITSSGDRVFNNLIGVRIENSQNTAITGLDAGGNAIGLYALKGSSGTQVGNSHFHDGVLAIYLQDGDVLGLDGEEETPHVITPGTDLVFTDNLTRFDNLAGYFQLGNGAMFGRTLDASQQTYEGVRGVDFNYFQYAAARLKTIDSETVPTVGYVYYGPVPPIPSGISQELLDQLLKRDASVLRDVFSYAGKTLEANYVLSPYSFSVQALNLSLLAPNAGGPTPPSPQNFGNLSPAAGPNTPPASGSDFASLAPAAGSNSAEGCGNGFLGNGLSDGNCGAAQ